MYICYDLFQPDYITELSWRHGLNDFTMPYQLQVQREQTHYINELREQVKRLSVKDQKKEQEENDAPILLGNQHLMIGAGPGSMNGQMPQMQMPMQTGFY